MTFGEPTVIIVGLVQLHAQCTHVNDPGSLVPGLGMVKFQTRNLGDDVLGSERMKITPLGAGSEVGRSCIIVEFKGKTIMVCVRGGQCVCVCG